MRRVNPVIYNAFWLVETEEGQLIAFVNSDRGGLKH